MAMAAPATGPRSWASPRAWLLGAVASAVVLVGAALVVLLGPTEGQARPADDAPPPRDRPGAELTVDVLTPDGDDDAYRALRRGDALEVGAAPGNALGNLRVAVTDAGARARRDQEVCATWPGPLDSRTQPGLVLRLDHEDGTTRAITVTNNIFADIRWRWNVHLWTGDTAELITRANLFSAFADEGIDDLPWNMCARAAGRDLSFTAWPASGARPGWSDGDRVGHVTLPPAWDRPGVAGWYVGHLVPGDATGYRDVATWDLDGSDGATAAPTWPAR